MKLSYPNVYFDKSLYCNGVVELKGEFIYDSEKNVYVQKVEHKIHNELAWLNYAIVEIEISNDNKKGVYKEYYKSGKLRRLVPFIIGDSPDDLYAHGIEIIYYEDKDSNGNDTYTILEENEYKNMDRIGIWKKYSIDGGLLSEHYYDDVIDLGDGFYGLKYKEYHNSNGALALSNEKNWGKAYYENGDIKAEWQNVNFRNDGHYIEYHENGIVKMEVHYKSGTRFGIMNKYYPDGKQKEKWSYTDEGKRVFVNKYYNNGKIKSEWIYKDGGLENKIEYDNKGNKKQ